MKIYDSRKYSISDFLEWHRNGLLELDPDFQRRSVWTEKAKSYLVDTIVRGKPMPKIFILERLEGARTVRVVVDGQQRLRAIFGFVEEDFTISRAHNEQYAGLPFSELPDETKTDFYQYALGVDILYDMTYAEILDVFARINSYTVTLNKQEKLNASYLGYFKVAAYRLGHQYASYFVDGGILSKKAVSRMGEATLASDLLIALLDGPQTSKNSEQFYRRYEDEPGGTPEASDRFDVVMSYLSSIYPTMELRSTGWSRAPLFYTLFTSIAHLMYGLKGLDACPVKPIGEEHIGRLRIKLDEIIAACDEVDENPDGFSGPREYRQFVDWTRRRTTDTAVRVSRALFVGCKLAEAI